MVCLKVSWQEISLFQNMLPINAFINVAFLFFSGLVRKFGSNPKLPKKIGPWNWGMDFLIALITFSIDFFVALNTKHEFSFCSKYHNMSFLVALNTNSIDFLVALITHSMNMVICEHFTNQTFKTTESTWIYSPNANLLWKKKNSWDCTFKVLALRTFSLKL